ncbi:hypothetical protein F5X96DRAFT_693024 [Biscogniauxia mediterranea]|nr:hypothetical protein F5X96DRAFT_693024 [Biscogniauxia mediterranea]
MTVSAILWAGFPGQDGGTAVFDILTGKASPAGRLPTTMYPEDYTRQVPLTDMCLRPSEDNPRKIYKWYNQAVIPFGFGLHYTSFKSTFSRNVDGTQYAIASLLDTCRLKYLDLCPFAAPTAYGPTPCPIKELAAYTRFKDVDPGEAEEAVLIVALGDLARVDHDGNTVLYPGTYEVFLDVPTSDKVSFELTGEAIMLIGFPQPPVDLGEGNGHETLPLS